MEGVLLRREVFLCCGYTFSCGGIYFYSGGGAFLWRVYGYCYEGMYFCVRDILLLQGGTLRQRHKHNYFGVALGPRLAINEVHACSVYHLCTWKKVVSEKDSQAKSATSSVRKNPSGLHNYSFVCSLSSDWKVLSWGSGYGV